MSTENNDTATGTSDHDQNQDLTNGDLIRTFVCNDLFLDCIFGFSKLEDIKGFRLVCRQWDKVAVPVLKKVSVISFGMPHYSLQQYQQDYRNFRHGLQLNLNKVKLSSVLAPRGVGRNLDWAMEDFAELMENLKRNTKELTIYSLRLNVQNVGYLDLDPYIEPGLTKVNIGRTYPPFAISTDRLMSTDFLDLEDCELRIVNGIKINPVGLTLKYVNVVQNGLEDADLNEFVNFDQLKYLSLDSVGFLDQEPLLKLHFKDPITLKEVQLFGRGLNLDFENAKWKITEKLYARNIGFSTPHGMEFPDLEFEGALLDLAVLPINLRKLKINERWSADTRVISSHPVKLPELEHLHLTVQRSFYQNRTTRADGFQMPWIEQFENCEFLTTLMLTFRKPEMLVTYPCKVDIGTVPKKVRNLYVYGDIEFSGDADVIGLKKLHLQKGDLSSLNSALSKFSGEQLVVDLRYFVGVTSVYQTVMEILELPFQTTVVALNHDCKQKSNPLKNCTDILSDFYIFVNKFGNAISKEQFEDLFDKEEKMREDY